MCVCVHARVRVQISAGLESVSEFCLDVRLCAYVNGFKWTVCCGCVCVCVCVCVQVSAGLEWCE